MSAKKKTFHIVTRKQIAELLNDTQWVRDNDFEKYLASPGFEGYFHPNGQLLFVPPKGNGRLHLSRENLLNKFKNPQKPRSVLYGRLPQGEAFITQVDDLVAQLPKLLRISSWRVDYSNEGLDKVSAAIRRFGKWRCLEVPIFPSLVAYIGEAMRTRLQGVWWMRLNRDDETWEPWIVAGEQAYNPWLDLVDILEEREGIYLPSLVDFRIRLGGGNPPGLGLPT